MLKCLVIILSCLCFLAHSTGAVELLAKKPASCCLEKADPNDTEGKTNATSAQISTPWNCCDCPSSELRTARIASILELGYRAAQMEKTNGKQEEVRSGV